MVLEMLIVGSETLEGGLGLESREWPDEKELRAEGEMYAGREREEAVSG